MNKSGMSASKCVAYARVSTENEGQAESCANQIALCQEYAERHPEYILDGKYVDDGISGATNKRPQFTAMIERIKQGDIRYIIAKNEDRLCRSTEIDGYLIRMMGRTLLCMELWLSWGSSMCSISHRLER